MMRTLRHLIVATLVVPMLALGGCSDDTTPPRQDGDEKTTDSRSVFDRDSGAVQQDWGSTNHDSQVWPDAPVFPDGLPFGSDAVDPYAGLGLPYGCQKDADCAGRQCCSTPWGVKVCADTCDTN